MVAGGHHGGAWKVAYADFVTAMMAFFLLMWLLNATTEKQRKGLSDYFNPTVPASRVSGGGDDMLMGDSLFALDTRARNRAGGTADEAGAADGIDQAVAEVQAVVEKALLDRGGESRTMEQLLRHVITRVTDEGVVIELFDLPDVPLFQEGGASPRAGTRVLATVLAEVLGLTANRLAVNGHLRRMPVTLADDPSWELSAARAQAMRQLLEATGVAGARFQRIGGFADRKPASADPGAVRNNRIEIILLRKDR